MKIYIPTSKNAILLRACPYFEDKDSRSIWTRDICICSATCVEDCKHINEYNEIEKYIVCNKFNEIDRKDKLNSL